MSENTTITAQAPANLHETKKAQAQARKAPATKKATAKPQANTSEKPAETEVMVWLATAQGRAGKTNVRRFPQPMNWAVDVADPDGKNPAAKAGLIYRFFATEDKATAYADRMREAGYDAKLVQAISEAAK